MKKFGLVQIRLIALLILLFCLDGFSQEGKDKYVGRYEAADENRNYVVELSIVPIGEYQQYQLSYEGQEKQFINLVETNFINAVMEAWNELEEKIPNEKSDMRKIAQVWFRQIIDRGITRSDVRQRETIGIISFSNQERKVHMLIKVKDFDKLINEDKKLHDHSKNDNESSNSESLKHAVAELKKELRYVLINEVDLKTPERISNDYYSLGTFPIDSVEIDFENGAVTVVKARVNVSGKIVGFERWARISVRGPREIADFNTVGKHYLKKRIGKFKLFLDLAQVISFDRKLLSGSGTYIPENKKVELTEQSTEINLFKERFYDNFDIRVYTDLTGLESDNPNGLVQIEGSYNIIPEIKELWSTRIFLFNTLNPFVTFSKIENKVDELVLSESTDGKSNLPTTSFDLFRFSHLNIGVDINLLSILTQSKKVRLNIIAGIFRTTVDSLVAKSSDSNTLFENRTVASWYYMPTIKYRFFDGSYIDTEFVYGWMRTGLIGEDIVLAGRDTKFLGLFGRNHAIHKFQINLNIHPNPDEKDKSIFLRASVFTDQKENNVSLQIGYSSPISKIFSRASEKATTKSE